MQRSSTISFISLPVSFYFVKLAALDRGIWSKMTHSITAPTITPRHAEASTFPNPQMRSTSGNNENNSEPTAIEMTRLYPVTRITLTYKILFCNENVGGARNPICRVMIIPLHPAHIPAMAFIMNIDINRLLFITVLPSAGECPCIVTSRSAAVLWNNRYESAQNVTNKADRRIFSVEERHGIFLQRPSDPPVHSAVRTYLSKRNHSPIDARAADPLRTRRKITPLIEAAMLDKQTPANALRTGYTPSPHKYAKAYAESPAIQDICNGKKPMRTKAPQASAARKYTVI